MVKYALQIQVEAENIEKIGVDKDTFSWWLRLECNGCREKDEKEHYLTLAETFPNKTGHGIVHYLAKCKFCSQEQTIEILPESIRDYVYGEEPQFSTIVIFDTRGVNPYSFSFREDWIITAKGSSTVFSGVDLSDGEWADWDEKGNQELVIYKLEYRFVKV
ncbi:UPF0587 protein v1g245604 [Anabrus simplex]|uniref:UPF0587 protein v1g245604 n=1 Tax=Anabrus simplex TaxID=316456 RepID=UPI0034DD3CF2